MEAKDKNTSNNPLLEQFKKLLADYEEQAKNISYYQEVYEYQKKEIAELKKTAHVPAPVYSFNIN